MLYMVYAVAFIVYGGGAATDRVEYQREGVGGGGPLKGGEYIYNIIPRKIYATKNGT